MVKIFKRSNGKLYLEYKVGTRVIQKSTRLKDTKTNRRLIEKEVIPTLERKIILGEIAGTKPEDFRYYAKIFLKDKEHIKTYDQLERIIEILNERFGDLRIDTINRGMVKEFVRDRLKIVTPKTLKNYLTPLRGIFNNAIDDEVIKDNPCNYISLPKHTRKTVEPFTSEQVAEILNNATGWLRSFLALCFYTGMRTGEVLALMHSDIDLENRVIRVKRSINKGKITTPKTESSIRDVPILDELIEYLPKIDKSLWVFPKDDGKPFFALAGSKQKEWRLLLERLNISYRKIYTTRHTFIVSMLKNTDLSILEVAQMVGHTSSKMIIQNYGQFIKGEHLKIDRRIKLFTDKSTDSILESSI